MTDIVERLRQAAASDVDETVRDGTLEASDIRRWSAMMRKAADEIERHRAGGCARDQHTTQFCAELRAAVAAENEACAKIVEKMLGADVVYPAGMGMIVAVIRARMEAKP